MSWENDISGFSDFVSGNAGSGSWAKTDGIRIKKIRKETTMVRERKE